MIEDLDKPKVDKLIRKLREKRDFHISKRNWLEALAIMDKMIELNASASSYTRRGMLFLKMRKYLSGVEDLQKALEIDPDYTKARDILNRFFTRQKATLMDFDETIEPEVTQQVENNSSSDMTEIFVQPDVTEVIDSSQSKESSSSDMTEVLIEPDLTEVIGVSASVRENEQTEISASISATVDASDVTEMEGSNMSQDLTLASTSSKDLTFAPSSTFSGFDKSLDSLGHNQQWQINKTILGLYDIVSVLGEGGFGIVHKVYHRLWGMDLAVKSPKGFNFPSAQHRRNFIKEAETWVNLGMYPHIVSCYYVRTLGGIPRVFVEYVEGGTLSDWIQSGKLYEGEGLEKILDVAIQVAWGLDYSHQEGLVHQDVKPSNVIMTQGGMAKVTDFGLAKARAVSGSEDIDLDSLSEEEILVSVGGMTLAYCSPEQMDKNPLSHRSDIWSWGVLVLEMFTKKVTWRYGAMATEVLENYWARTQKNPRKPNMPEALMRLLEECFAREPEKRPKNLGVISQRLEQIYRDSLEKDYKRSQPQVAQWMADGLNNRAISLLDLEKGKEAQEFLEEAITSQPHHLQANYNLVLLLWRQGKLNCEAVIQKLRAVQSAQSGSAESYFLLAWVWMEYGDALAAQECFDETKKSGCKKLSPLVEKAEQLIQPGSDHIATWDGHSNTIHSVTMSKDESTLVTGGFDKKIRVWDRASQDCLQEISENSYVSCVVLAQNDSHIIASNGNREIRCWDLKTGELLGTFRGHSDNMRGLCLIPKRELLVSVSDDMSIRVWNMQDYTCQHIIQREEGKIFAVSFLQGNQIITGGTDRCLRVWDFTTGECLQVLEGHTRDVTGVASCGKGKWAVSTSWDKTIRVWDVVSGECVHVLTGHKDKISQVYISSDEKWILSSSWDCTVKVWEMETGRCTRTIGTKQEGHIYSFAWGDSGLVITGNNRTLQIWELRSGLPEAPFAVVPPQKSEELLNNQNLFQEKLILIDQAIAEKDWPKAIEELALARSISGYTHAPQCLELWNFLAKYAGRGKLRGAWFDKSLKGHSGRVNGAAINETGQFTLSASDDKTIRMWNIKEEKEEYTLEGHQTAVTHINLSWSGETALSGDLEGVIKLWDLKKRTCLSSWKAHSEPIQALAFSGDGKIIISSDQKASLKIWNTEAKNLLLDLLGHREMVSDVAITLDRRYALSASYDKTIRAWDLKTGQCVALWLGHNDRITSIVVNIEKQWAVSAGQEGEIRRWSFQTGKSVLMNSQGDSEKSSGITSLALSSDGNTTISTHQDRTLRVWDVEKCTCLCILEGHQDTITQVNLASDNTHVVTSSLDHNIALWHLDWELIPQESQTWDERLQPCLETFLCCSYTKIVDKKGCCEKIIWEDHSFQCLLKELQWRGFGWISPLGIKEKLQEIVENWKCYHLGMEDKTPLEEAENNHQLYQETIAQWEDAWQKKDWDQTLALVSQMRNIPGYEKTKQTRDYVYQTAHRSVRGKFQGLWRETTLEGHQGAICGLLISADGKTVFSGSGDRTIRVWDVQTERCLKILEGHESTVSKLALSSDERFLASCSPDQTARIWDLETGSCLRVFRETKGEVYCVKWVGEDRFFITASHDQVRVWNPKTGEEIQSFQGHQGWVMGVDASEDGRIIASSGFDATVRIWDIESGKCLQVFQGHAGWVMGISLTPDGKTAISTGADKTARIWDVQSGKCLHVLAGDNEGWLWCSALTPDGRYAFCIGQGGNIYLWDIMNASCVFTISSDETRVIGVSSTPIADILVTSGSSRNIKIWQLDWQWLAGQEESKDVGRYLKSFLFNQRDFSSDSKSWSGEPTWSEKDWSKLSLHLQQRGFGRISEEEIQNQLTQEIAQLDSSSELQN